MDHPVAANLRLLRDRLKMTQEHLAQAAGVQVRTVQRAEAGEPLSAETLRALAGVFNVDPDELMRPPNADAVKQIKERFDIVPLKAAVGSTAWNLIADSMAVTVECDVPDESLQDEVALLETEVVAAGRAWSNASPIARREKVKQLAARVATIQDAGGVVALGLHRTKAYPLQGAGPPVEVVTLYVTISKAANPVLHVVVEKTLQVEFSFGSGHAEVYRLGQPPTLEPSEPLPSSESLDSAIQAVLRDEE